MNAETILRIAITTEFSIIVLILLLSILLKIYFSIKQQTRARISKKIENYLESLMTQDLKFDVFKYKNNWRKPDLTLLVIKKLNPRYETKVHWQEIKTDMIQKLFRKIAHKVFAKKNWISKFYGLKLIEIVPAEEDIPFLKDLIKNSNILVSMTAAKVALLLCDKNSIEIFIKETSKERPLTQSIHLQIFDDIKSDAITQMLKNFLQHENDPYIRATIYSILIKSPTSDSVQNIDKDLNSKTLNLKISALKYLGQIEGQKASSQILSFLQAPEWQLRVTALHILKNIKLTEATEKISSCLYDKEWWVRYAASETLASFGEQGIKILESEEIKKDEYALDIAHYVLESLNLKE